MNNSPKTFVYTFNFPLKKQLKFTISRDKSIEDILKKNPNPPQWTSLDNHRCPPCTLNIENDPFCPIALQIAELVKEFADIASYEPCEVTCHSIQRTVVKKTVAQEGLTSILGLLMASSGCPVMTFFKPLAQFHLPFASVEESIFRVASIFLFQQYYAMLEEPNYHFSLEHIKAHYSRVKCVNEGMLKRLKDIKNMDANNNAIVSLTGLVQIFEIELQDNFESLQSLFSREE